MAENSNKLKRLKLYEILCKDTDIDRPLSRQELLKVLSDQGAERRRASSRFV